MKNVLHLRWLLDKKHFFQVRAPKKEDKWAKRASGPVKYSSVVRKREFHRNIFNWILF